MEHAAPVPTVVTESAVAVKGDADRSQKIRIEQHSATGILWLIGWLFSVGFLHLSFWKGLLALIIWPYYLGSFVSTLLSR